MYHPNIAHCLLPYMRAITGATLMTADEAAPKKKKGK